MSSAVNEAAEKADVPFINQYCQECHRGVVRCDYSADKGRILRSGQPFKAGEVVFREPPLHIVAEAKENTVFRTVLELCGNRELALEYEPLWYWTALCSLRADQLPDGETRLQPIADDKQRKLLLLYHPEIRGPTAATQKLVKELGLDGHLDPMDYEILLQTWILNCFEHSDEPLGYSTYFMSSFMSHSCLPNAVWHYEEQDDDFVLRARSDIGVDDEITVSYLSEDQLLEAVHARRKHLQASKSFLCECTRCTVSLDLSRGFWDASGEKSIFAAPASPAGELSFSTGTDFTPA